MSASASRVSLEFGTDSLASAASFSKFARIRREEQARKYVDALLGAIESLSNFPGLGQACPQIYKGYH